MIGLLRNFILNRKIAGQNRKIRASNIESANSALILYAYQGDRREKEVRDFARYLKEEGLKVTTLAYMPNKSKEGEEPKEELQYFYFDKSELSWLRIPKSSRLKKIIATDYDLMLDLNLEEYFPLKWISNASHSFFKVGCSGGYQDESCDLLLSLKEKSIAELQEQSRIYLKMINRREEH